MARSSTHPTALVSSKAQAVGHGLPSGANSPKTPHLLKMTSAKGRAVWTVVRFGLP